MSETYNGWSDYETWAVALWLDNDEGTQRHWEDRAEACYREAAGTTWRSRLEKAAYDLGQEMQADIAVEGQPELGNNLYSDLLSAALSEVNWNEVATHFLEEIAKEVDKQEAQDAIEP